MSEQALEATPQADLPASPSATPPPAGSVPDGSSDGQAADDAADSQRQPGDRYDRMDEDRLREEVRRLARQKNAAYDGKSAAEEARQALANQVGKILGLVEDEVPADATVLTQQLAESQRATKQAALELAIYKAAGDTANPAALLDSRSFLNSVADVDPTDSAAIANAITQAVTSNPAFSKAVGSAPALKPNPAQGSSAQPPLGLAEQAQAVLAAGNTREALRLKARMAAAGSDQ